MIGLPPGWADCKLEELLSEPLRNGKSAREHPRGRVRVLTLTAVTQGSFSEENTKLVDLEPSSVEDLYLRNGDILIERSNTPELVGTARTYEGRPHWAIFPDLIIRARLHAEVMPRFVEYALAREDTRAYFRRSAQGMAGSMPKISQETILATRVPLPPREEQRRLVAALDESLTRIRRGEAELRLTRTKLATYRAAVLRAACEGRLVPTEAELARAEGREPEASQAIVRRVLERRKATSSKHPMVSERQLIGLPAGWVQTSLDSLLAKLRNGIAAKPEDENGLRILRISAVRPGKVDLEDVRFLPENFVGAENYSLMDGDLLFTRYNGNPQLVGVCGVVRGLTVMTVHPDKLIRGQLAAPDLILPEWIQITANVGQPRAYLAEKVRTTAGQAGLSGGDLKAMPIPIPPTSEQHRIVAEVERRLSVVERLEAAIDANLARAKRLRQAILKRAFEGRLVPQDPRDEPASVLLERVRKERTAVPRETKKGRKTA